MTDEEIFRRITDIVRRLAKRPDLVLTPSTVFADIDDWDSLNHVELEMALEEEFKVGFEMGEFEELADIAAMTRSLSGKTAD